jgi:hypothetical protein
VAWEGRSSHCGKSTYLLNEVEGSMGYFVIHTKRPDARTTLRTYGTLNCFCGLFYRYSVPLGRLDSKGLNRIGSYIPKTISADKEFYIKEDFNAVKYKVVAPAAAKSTYLLNEVEGSMG